MSDTHHWVAREQRERIERWQIRFFIAVAAAAAGWVAAVALYMRCRG